MSEAIGLSCIALAICTAALAIYAGRKADQAHTRPTRNLVAALWRNYQVT